MKLLFDQNLSHRLVKILTDEFPDSAHVRDTGFEAADDSDVWTYAAVNGFVIVSKDIDFQQRALLYGHPPKVIWLRLGNCSTAVAASLLLSKLSHILEFEADQNASFLVLC